MFKALVSRLLMLYLAIGACVSQANVVVFADDFESGNCVLSSMCVYASVRDASHWQAAGGTHSLEVLAGPEPTFGGLLAGYMHRISFDLAGNPDGPDQRTFTLCNDYFLCHTWDVDSASSTTDQMNWQSVFWDVWVPPLIVPADIQPPLYTNWRIYFTNSPIDRSSTFDGTGVVIDNFQITALVPEPGSLALAALALLMLPASTRGRSAGRNLKFAMPSRG